MKQEITNLRKSMRASFTFAAFGIAYVGAGVALGAPALLVAGALNGILSGGFAYRASNRAKDLDAAASETASVSTAPEYA